MDLNQTGYEPFVDGLTVRVGEMADGLIPTNKLLGDIGKLMNARQIYYVRDITALLIDTFTEPKYVASISEIGELEELIGRAMIGDLEATRKIQQINNEDNRLLFISAAAIPIEVRIQILQDCASLIRQFLNTEEKENYSIYYDYIEAVSGNGIEGYRELYNTVQGITNDLVGLVESNWGDPIALDIDIESLIKVLAKNIARLEVAEDNQKESLGMDFDNDLEYDNEDSGIDLDAVLRGVEADRRMRMEQYERVRSGSNNLSDAFKSDTEPKKAHSMGIDINDAEDDDSNVGISDGSDILNHHSSKSSALSDAFRDQANNPAEAVNTFSDLDSYEAVDPSVMNDTANGGHNDLDRMQEAANMFNDLDEEAVDEFKITEQINENTLSGNLFQPGYCGGLTLCLSSFDKWSLLPQNIENLERLISSELGRESHCLCMNIAGWLLDTAEKTTKVERQKYITDIATAVGAFDKLVASTRENHGIELSDKEQRYIAGLKVSRAFKVKTLQRLSRYFTQVLVLSNTDISNIINDEYNLIPDADAIGLFIGETRRILMVIEEVLLAVKNKELRLLSLGNTPQKTKTLPNSNPQSVSVTPSSNPKNVKTLPSKTNGMCKDVTGMPMRNKELPKQCSGVQPSNVAKLNKVNVRPVQNSNVPQVKCIARGETKQRMLGDIRTIKVYILRDIRGNTMKFNGPELKRLIANGKLDVINLKLTSDNRLIIVNR